MLNRDEISSVGNYKGLIPKFAELDYIQDIGLLSIYREFGRSLIFKGGTCLYKIYQLNRFSEDLDFTAVKGFKPKNFFERLPYFFNLVDLKSKVKVEKFEKGINVYLDIFGPLYDGKKETMATLLLNISMRERVLLPVSRQIYTSEWKTLKSFDVFSMNEKEILAEKVRTIYSRNKARDVYDLWFLLKIRKLTFDLELIKTKLKLDGTKFEKNSFLVKVNEKSLSWGRDLATLVNGELPAFERVKKEIEELLWCKSGFF